MHPASQAFGGVASTYQHARPGYPDSAVDHLRRSLRLGRGGSVLDLAAGTGKLTERLRSPGLRVVAVEPVAGMLAELQRRLPDIEARRGTAESIPADRGEFDAVAVAQAFHWFDHTRALSEIVRVLAPGGAVGLLWNRRAPDDLVWAQVEQLLGRYRGDTPAHRDHAWRQAIEADDRYEALEDAHFEHDQHADRQLLVDRVASISFVAALSVADRADLLTEVHQLPTTLDLPAQFCLRYVTEVHTTRLR